MLLLLGIAALAWSGFSLMTGKGYYRGCPPGGYDRRENPFNYWLPTIMIALLGTWLVLGSFGMLPRVAGVNLNTCPPSRTQ